MENICIDIIELLSDRELSCIVEEMENRYDFE